MKKLDFSLRNPDSKSLFHDTRADAKLLKEVINRMINKIDELVTEVNSLHEEVTELKKLKP